MNKLATLLALLIVPATIFSCNDDERIVSTKDLPQASQHFLTTHFPNQTVSHATYEENEYEVYLNNGMSISFDKQGNWDDIDGRNQQLPQSVLYLIPAAIVTYVSEHYSGAFIEEINKERWGYEIDLSNQLELEFDTNGNFLRVDN